MYQIEIPRIGTFDAWRDAARALLSNGVPPDQVVWQSQGADRGLFEATSPLPTAKPLTVPRSFLGLAQSVVWHTDAQRFAWLYGFLWRLHHAPNLMRDRTDPDLARLRAMEKAVHRCQHKMKAFVRFRELPSGGDRRAFAAWFEPTHHTVEPTAQFFRRRFADMDWCIATPDVTVRHVSGDLCFSTDEPRPDLPPDAQEALWLTYYRNIFNPARLKIAAMTSEMPRKYWKNLPEAAAIPDLIASADARAAQMVALRPTAAPRRAEAALAQARSLGSAWQSDPHALDAGIAACTRCSLHCHATQAVPGAGPRNAPIMIVGEQPGDQEDLCGKPFVGPAGQLFDRIARQAGLARDACYVTNAVKHFKYTPRGKRRIHQRPNSAEISHCRWWLEAEINLVQPHLIVAMGAVAAEALTGTGANLLNRCGGIERVADRPPILITVHPSFAMRAPEAQMRKTAADILQRDLVTTASWLDRAQQADTAPADDNAALNCG